VALLLVAQLLAPSFIFTGCCAASTLLGDDLLLMVEAAASTLVASLTFSGLGKAGKEIVEVEGCCVVMLDDDSAEVLPLVALVEAAEDEEAEVGRWGCSFGDGFLILLLLCSPRDEEAAPEGLVVVIEDGLP
jgi:hypothetical protein